MKGFLGVEAKTLMSMVLIFILLGSQAVSLVESTIFAISCFGCDAGKNAFFTDIKAILTIGNSNLNDGVNGLLELEKDSNNLSSLQKQTLAKTYKDNIMKGLAFTVGFIALIGFLIIKYHIGVSNFDPPWVMTLLLAILFSAIIQWILSGFELPYTGLWNLITHLNVISNEFLNAISPIPIASSQ